MKPANFFLVVGILVAAIARSSSQTLSTVQFAALSYSVSETGGVAIITVERIGEPGGTASVAYSTSNRTATDGEDYTGHFGSLVFNGETNLTIAVSILDDAVAEGNETVLIELFNPLDTVLGERRRAVLVIRDDDSPQAPIPPLTRWHERAPLLTSEELRSVVYGNGRFVAVGDRGAIVTSDDGGRWFLADSGTGAYLAKVAYGNGRFVAVGDVVDGLLTSSDGMHWIQTSCAQTNCSLNSITFGGSRFVAVGGEVVLTSTNGLDWQRENTGVNIYLADVAYGDGIFMAVGRNEILTSSNGGEWRRRHFDFDVGESGGLTTVVYGNGTFALVYGWVCCCCAQLPRSATYLFTSVNAVDWTLQMSWHWGPRPGSLLRDLSYGEGHFTALVGGVQAGLLLSTDLTLATTHAYPPPPDGIASMCIGNHNVAGVGRLIVQSDPLLRLTANHDGSATLDLSGPLGSLVRVEAADNPVQTNAWQVLGTLSLTNGPQAWTDPQATNSSNRFYRAVLLP